MTNIRLYGYWRSSATYRVRLGLLLKKIPFAYTAVHLRNGEQHEQAYQSSNPLGQVPTLEWQEGSVQRRLTQSLPILEYLEERFEKPSILPSDAYLRARCRQMAEVVNAGIQPLQNLAVLARLGEAGVDKQAWLSHFLSKGLGALDELCRDTMGTYLVGDHVSMADLCLVPQLEASRRLGVDVAPFGRLLAVEARCQELPAFVTARPEHQPDAELGK